MRSLVILASLVCLAACGRAAGELGPDAGSDDAGANGQDAGASDAGPADAGTHADGGQDAGGADAGNTDAGSADAGSSDGGASGESVIRVHYPLASGHTLSLRGSGGQLNWTAGQALTASGSNTFTYSLGVQSAAIEFKPVLDDNPTTPGWSRGPNYRVPPGQTVDVYPHFTTTHGTVSTLIASFHSTVLSNNRAIYAYFPPSYSENPAATYPVVYMHDGQNLWAALPQLAFGATWNVDTAFDSAAETGICSANGQEGWAAAPLGGTPKTCNGDSDCTSGTCRTFPEAIVIAPANTAGRIYEYTPTPDNEPPGTPGGSTPGGGGGDLYIEMLVNELKPQIETQLAGRVRTGPANTALVGSSLGGLISVYAGYKRPDIYGLIGGISPSTWWSNDGILADIRLTQAAPDRPLRVYIDSGSGTADDEADTDQLDVAYIALGYQPNINYRHVVQSGATHSETYWAERFPGAMQLLLGER